MKETILPVLLSLAMMACDPIDYHLTTGVSRIEAFGGHGRHGPDNNGDSIPSVRTDTVAYMTGVEFPESYDWVRDTAYGDVAARIVLFRDGEAVMSLATGPAEKISADPDMHHLVGGHVFSEYSSKGRTWIKKDGEELCSYDKAEKLRGLLVKGHDVFTLGQAKSGHGFSLRKNGQVIYEKDEGKVLGMMDSDSFFRGGALYEDQGVLCFSYRSSSGGTPSGICCLVADGKETFLNSQGNILDIRRIDGKTWVLEQDADGIVWIRCGDYLRALQVNSLSCTEVCRLSVWKGNVVATGDYGNPYSGYGSCVWDSSGNVLIQNSGKTDFYLSDRTQAKVQVFGGRTALSFNEGQNPTCLESGKQMYFPFRGAVLKGMRFILCTTPSDLWKSPVVYDGGIRKEIELRGFLSGVELVEEAP